MDFTAVSNFLAANNEPSFRLKQLRKNYFSGRYSSFDEMTDLSLPLRQKLSENFSLFSVSEDLNVLGDSTQKVRLKLRDGCLIESVLMDYEGWLTACISSQVGCPLGCTFCATGKMGFKRNLTSEEIVDQILYWNHKLYPKYVGRIVFMGMGEPFLNWDNLMESLKSINSKDGLNIGSRKISISTAGIVPKIIEFANLNTEINLAVSLHSADQTTREQMMPVARQYSLHELKESLDYYTCAAHRQVFFEYLLAKDINDSPRHLKLLIDFIKSNKLFYLNLIPLNPVKGGLTPSGKLKNFEKELTKAGVNFSVRRSLGTSVNSACGQLITN